MAASLHERYLGLPDFVEFTDGPVPSFWMGEAGILFVIHRLAAAAMYRGALARVCP